MSRSADSEDEADSHVPLLADHDHRSFGDNAHTASHTSLLSPLSGKSQEVKYVFEPCSSQTERERDSYSDYSHINVRSKAPYLRDGPYSGRPPPPPYYNHYGRNSTASFQYGFQPGIAAPTGVQRFHLQQHQTVSLEDVSRQDSARRTSWSPAFVAPGHQAGRKDLRVCQNGNGIEWNSFQHAAYTGQDYNKNGVEWDSFKYAAYNGQSQPQNKIPGHFQNGKIQSHVPAPTSHLQRKSPQSSDKQVDCVPPRLAPISGVLSEKASKNLIRPVAFKPNSAAQGNTNVCHQCGKETSLCGGCSNFVPSFHQGKGLSPVHPASTRYNTEFFNEAAFVEDNDDDSPGVNVDQSPSRKAPSACSSTAGFWGTSEAETPSPSDSGVCELEAMLKEREAEILTLRQVMDRNERAIFQVYEEKKNKWLQDMREIKEEYEHKLKVQQQKATKLEQALASQVRRLQQEKQQLAGKFSDLQADKDCAIGHSQDQLDSCCSNSETSSLSLSLSSTPKKASARSSPEDLSLFPSLQGQMAMKNTEIMALRSQLEMLQKRLEEKDELLSKTQEEVSSKTEELDLAREELDQLSGGESVWEKSTQTYISDLNSKLGVQQPGVISEEEYTQSLERQIDALREQVQTAEILVETERLLWVEEKNKVIRYQKQLQLNYVQMQRKNIALEAEVEQLTMELESREMKLAAVNGEEESVC